MANNYLRLYEGLKVFRDAMVPFIEEKLQAAYGDDWWQQGVVRCFPRRDMERLRVQFEKRHDSLVIERPGDKLVEMLDINYFGNIIEANWKQVFADIFGDRKVIGWLHEVREARNPVAHPQTGDLQRDDVWRALDNAERILMRVNSTVASEIQRLKYAVFAPVEPHPSPALLEASWEGYCDSLESELESESLQHGVPLDILENRVTEYDGARFAGLQAERGEAWLEASFRQGKGLIVLLGNPGEGKTVSFSLLAKRLLEDARNDPNSPLPLRVHLAFFERDERSLKELVAEQLRFGDLAISSALEVPAVLAQRRFAVLMDGLNEVSDRVTLIGELRNLMSRAPNNMYFLSCRRADYDQVQGQLPPRKAWQLQRFEVDDIQRFLRQVLQTDPDRKNKLEMWLSDDRLLEVLGTPFFLSLFANLDLKELPLPRNRAELCQVFGDSFHSRELKASADRQPVGDPWPILEAVAFRMQESRTTHLPTTQFEDLGRRVWTEQLYGQETSASRHETLEALYQSPLLHCQPGTVAFAHQLFQDYFAARALEKGISGINIREADSFRRFVADPWWDYTIVLLAGLLPDATSVLYSIVYEGTKYDLAVRCLYEAGQLDPRVVHDVVEWLRKSHRFAELAELGPLVAQLPKSATEWRVAEVEAIIRTMLTDEVGYLLWGWWTWLAIHGWPASEEMIYRAALDALQSSHEIERGNSLPILALQGRWDIILELVTDPSLYVRAQVAYAISHVAGEDDDPERLFAAITQLSQDSEPQVRQRALEAASRFITDGGLAVLQEGLRDSDADVWQTALDEFVKCVSEEGEQALAQVVPVLTQRLEELPHLPGSGVGEQTGRLLSALAKVDTDESSNALFAAMVRDQARPAFVASVLARRGDPRAARAVLLDLTLEMIEFPEQYLETPWRDFIFTGKELPESRKEFVEAELSSLSGRQFKLDWLESLLLLEETTAASLVYDSAFEELRRLCRSNREALSVLLWTCLIAWGKLVEWTEPTDSLLDASIWHLIEIDPTVLVEFITDPERPYLLWPADEFAARILRTTAILTSLLTDEKRKCLLDTYAD